MSDLVERVARTLAEHRSTRAGQRWLVAVSGGVDSMVLLTVLARLAPRYRWSLAVAHLDHCLRGRASEVDARFVKKVAGELGLPCFLGKANVSREAERRRVSVEMAARELRHRFLADSAGRFGARAIALAHHADDQVELFFLRLLRGAGSEGLAGMEWLSPSPVNPAIGLVRPLLGVSKAQLLEFAREQRIVHREDASNRSTDFLRNRIRLELLPLLRGRFQPALDAVVLRLMEILRAESALVDRLAVAAGGAKASSLAEAQLVRAADAGTSWFLASEPKARKAARSASARTREVRETLKPSAFAPLPLAVQRRMLHRGLVRLGLTPEFERIERLRNHPGEPLSVAPGVTISRDDAGHLHRATVRSGRFRAEEFSIRFLNTESERTRRRSRAGGEGQGTFAGGKFSWTISLCPGDRLPRPQAGVEFFDADQIGSGMILRHWRPGDRFQPIGMTAAVKLQDLFTNAKVPRVERYRRVVAATEAGEVCWVEGLRIGEQFKLTATTEHRLEWRWQRK